MAAAAFLVCTLTGCIGPHKIDKWVARHYEDEPIEAPRHKSEQISFVSKLPVADDGQRPSVTRKNRRYMLPLLFYWKYDYNWACTLNPDVPVNNFQSTVASYARGALKQKLNGNHLELTIRQLPNSFLLDDRGWYIWTVFYGFGIETISIQPPPADMVVSYRLLNGSNEEVKTGSIMIADLDKTVTLKMFHSLKKTVWKYLEQYDANIGLMSKKLVDRLAGEL